MEGIASTPPAAETVAFPRTGIPSKLPMQIASVYRLKDRVLAHANVRTETGLWIATEPFLQLPLDADEIAIGAAVHSLLQATTVPIPDQVNWRSMAKRRLIAAGVRSERAFMSRAHLVEVVRSDTGYVIESTRNGGSTGDDRGFHPLPAERSSLQLECTTQELGAAVIAAFGRACTNEC